MLWIQGLRTPNQANSTERQHWEADLVQGSPSHLPEALESPLKVKEEEEEGKLKEEEKDKDEEGREGGKEKMVARHAC